ncbi:AI-2E family transporter [Rhizobium sp. G21]|uniref:AI-2E family transporter n=1 Tax=Rhizobium sp. G21 TaxID=2758439 RepID=UPI001603B2F9|nr:AI-2E family transporter [Rhizobium sp. G21]MBB1248210.1 AI-2E family transporter [Rhizobium sp. G21]
MEKRVSLLVFGLGIAILTILAPGALFVVFAGVLLAILFRACGDALAGAARIAPIFGLVVFFALLLAALALAVISAAPAISEQTAAITEALPKGLAKLKERIDGFGWGERLLDRDFTEAIRWPAATNVTTGVLSTTFGALGDLVIILFIGLYGAFDPQRYRAGLILMFAPSIRPDAEEVLDRSVDALRNWLVGQLIAMALIGLLTGLGLWLIDMPLALLLGLIAAFFAFVPNIGPVLAAIPGILIALPDGMNKAFLAIGIYAGVQALESYVVTPLIQRRRVKLQPAFVISTQILFGSLFGLMGLAIATPFAALVKTLTQELYIKRYLEREPAPKRGKTTGPPPWRVTRRSATRGAD